MDRVLALEKNRAQALVADGLDEHPAVDEEVQALRRKALWMARGNAEKCVAGNKGLWRWQ
jgi:hypothetical protein